MNEKYKAAFDYINEGKYEDAYNYFSNIVDENKNDTFARFYRSLVAFSYLPTKMQETIDDLELLANSKNKYTNISKAYLSIVYCNIEMPLKSIEYGECAVKSTDEGIEDVLLDIYFSLSKSYMMLGDPSSLEMALKCVDYCIEESVEDIADVYINKIDILSRMNRFDEAETTLSTLYVKFGSSFSYYYISAELNILIYKAKDDKDYLQKALNDVNVALQYESDSSTIILLKARIYSLLKDLDNALKTVELVKDDFEEDEYLMEVFNIYEEFDDYDSIVKLCNKYLENKESWRIYYTLAFIKAKSAITKEEIEEVKELYLKSYNVSKKIIVFNEIYRLNFVLNKDELNIPLVEDLLKINPKDGRLQFLLAEAKHRTNYSYDEILDLYEKSYNLGFLDELRYYTMITPLVKKPSKNFHILRKYKNIEPGMLSPWMVRKIGIRYLYGEEGCSKDMKKARLYLEHAYKELMDESCMNSTYGRLLELEEKYDEAFKLYQHAYELQKEELIPECNCANGYLAHAYINGIGTNKNIEEAKKLIQEGISLLEDKSSNIVIYLYAYFALLNEKGFDLLKAKELLELKYPYYRYEITRPMMLKRIYQRLNIDTKALDDEIWECRWKGDSLNSKYYFKNKRKDIIYPAFNNY